MAILALAAAYAASFAPYHALYHLPEGIFPALWSGVASAFHNIRFKIRIIDPGNHIATPSILNYYILLRKVRCILSETSRKAREKRLMISCWPEPCKLLAKRTFPSLSSSTFHQVQRSLNQSTSFVTDRRKSPVRGLLILSCFLSSHGLV
jgi:hypothetical protein